MAYGGIVISASSCSSVTSWSMSYRWNASTYLASSSDWSASTDAGRCSSGSAASVARARCSALFTAATLVPRVAAASAAGIFSTSHMIRVARCLAGRCCSAVTNASRMRVPGHRDLGRVAVLGHDLGVGDRGDPDVVRVPVAEQRLDRRRGRPEVDRQRPPLPPAQHVQADVGGDPVQPGAHARPALEPVGRAPGAQHRLLHGVVGFETRAQHAVAVAGELPAVLLQVVRANLGGGSRRHSSPPYVATLTFSGHLLSRLHPVPAHQLPFGLPGRRFTC